MLNITTIGVSLDCGVIQPLYRTTGKISTVTVQMDAGSIPPKKHFKPKLQIACVSFEQVTDNAVFTYQVYPLLDL